MKDEDPVVGGEPQVAFDPGAEFDGGGEGGKAVLRGTSIKVQAPVREPPGTRVERIRP